MTLFLETDEDLDTSYSEWEYAQELEAYEMLSQMLEDEEADSNPDF